VWEVLSRANYLLIFFSVFLSWISHYSRAVRWKYMLEPMGYKTSVWSNYHAVMTGYFMNLLIPRAGEISRAGLIHRIENVAVDKALGTIIAERVIDVIMLGTISVITIFLQYDKFEQWRGDLNGMNVQNNATNDGFSWMYVILAVLAAMFIGFIILLFVSEKFREKVRGFAKGLTTGVMSILRMKKKWHFIGHTFLIWFLYVALYIICFYSIDETSAIPVKGLMLGFLAGSIGIIFVQGGIGVYPLMVAGALGLYDADRDIVIALGWIVWAAQTLLLVVAGAISFYLVSGKAVNQKTES
jgi:glycosyltransferase 2 family protein